jgi:hypothetical protein
MDNILAAIDEEIARLQKVRSLLSTNSGVTVPRKRGRKPGATVKKTKRVLSPEARAKIAAAQKRRWAAQKKAK